MQKFALKLLLARLMFGGRSKRVEGIQVAANCIIFVVIVCIGIYGWMHGVY